MTRLRESSKQNARQPITIPVKSGNIETEEATSITPLTPYNLDTVRGFIKLTLQSPDFGHRAYANLYTRAITDLNNKVEGTVLPNQAYTPTLQSISLDYTASKEIDQLNAHQHIFHIHPFGWSSHTSRNDTPYLFPHYQNEGNLLIGIAHLQPPSDLSILFQVREGSANPDSAKPIINWSYLSNDEWLPLEGPAILRDETNHFNSSGVITFSIPADASDQNQTLPTTHHWLRASAANNSDGYMHTISYKSTSCNCHRSYTR